MAAGDFIDIDFTGEVKLMKALSRLEKKEAAKIVRPALRAGGKVVLEETKRRVPVDRGELRRSLKLRAARSSRRRGAIGVRINTGTREELGIPPWVKSYYPAHLELGAFMRPARSYMRTAMDAKREEAIAIISQTIRAGLIKEFRI